MHTQTHIHALRHIYTYICIYQSYIYAYIDAQANTKEKREKRSYGILIYFMQTDLHQ